MMLDTLTILSFIIRLLESIVYIYITHQLLDRKLPFKVALIMGVILAFFWDFSNLFGSGVIKNLLLYRILMIVIIYLYTRANILKVSISAFVSSNISLMIEYTVVASVTLILDSTVLFVRKDVFTHFTAYLIAFVFGFIFYSLLKKYNISLFDNNRNYLSVDRTFSQNNNLFAKIKELRNDYNVLIIIFITQMTLITYYFYSREYFVELYSAENTHILSFQIVLLSIIILILNVATLFIATKLEKVRVEKYYNKIKQMEYEQIEKENLIIKQYKHDMNNHFTLLCGLAKEKKHDEVYSYLFKYHEDMNSKTISVKTGLDELDVLLYSKINRAQRKNIKIDYKCSANIQCNKEHIINLISILGNLLDNAIEASEKSQKKIIDISINEGVVRYFFTIKNTFNNTKIDEPDVLLQEGFTTKGVGRGQGLKIVNRLVKKYNGKIEFKNSKDFFEITVILPKHEINKY